MRLAWMLVDVYRQPRRLRCYGSISRQCCSRQGISADCSHATGMLVLLTLRALKGISSISPCISPRALVDDVSIQLLTDSLKELPLLEQATRTFTADMFGKDLWTQAKKYGLVADLNLGRRFASRFAKQLSIIVQLWMRNLGHEMASGRAKRTQQHKRNT
eukprot:6741452-Pyramimonas_sp.AAC.1